MALNNIIKQIANILSLARTPLVPIQAALIIGGSVQRPGLSPMLIASNIIRRQSEAGAPSGPMPDGSSNVAEAMERIRVEEIVNAIKSDMKIEVGIPVGGIQIQGTGTAAGVPVVVEGFNINPVHGDGIAR